MRADLTHRCFSFSSGIFSEDEEENWCSIISFLQDGVNSLFKSMSIVGLR